MFFKILTLKSYYLYQQWKIEKFRMHVGMNGATTASLLVNSWMVVGEYIYLFWVSHNKNQFSDLVLIFQEQAFNFSSLTASFDSLCVQKI